MSGKGPDTRRVERVSENTPDLMQELSKLRKPIAGESELADTVTQMVREGELYEKGPDNRVHCYACGHHCKISDGGRGICQVRYNLGGKLFVPRGYVAALQCDPIEKKPFFHVHPGSDALTFGMLGCDIHCSYCQNWDISQALRDASAGRPPTSVTPQQLVEVGQRYGAKVFASSYNEPLITSEWAAEIFKEAQVHGFTCAYVSNGNATRGVLEYLRPYVSAYKIDLKSMRDRSYRQLGAPLQNILDGVQLVHAFGFWLEIVTLIVPGFNDSIAELRDAAQFIASISRDIPWHVTAFHQDYKMQDHDNTSVAMLLRACEIGREAGLYYVYAGNLPGRVGEWEHTFCPNCHTRLIERFGYTILNYGITGAGKCPRCGTQIAGLFPQNPREVRLGSADLWFTRRPRPAR